MPFIDKENRPEATNTLGNLAQPYSPGSPTKKPKPKKPKKKDTYEVVLESQRSSGSSTYEGGARSLGIFLWYCAGDKEHTSETCCQVIDPKGLGALKGIKRGHKLLSLNGKCVSGMLTSDVKNMLQRALSAEEQVTMTWEAGTFAGKSHEGAPIMHTPSTMLGLFSNRSKPGYAVVCGGALEGTQLCVFGSKEEYADALVQSCVYGYRLQEVPVIQLNQSIRVTEVAEGTKCALFYFEIAGMDGFRPFKDRFAMKDEQALRKLHKAINEVLKLQARAKASKNFVDCIKVSKAGMPTCLRSRLQPQVALGSPAQEELSLVSRDIGALNTVKLAGSPEPCLSPNTYQQL
jgi:hypothetical protein